MPALFPLTQGTPQRQVPLTWHSPRTCSGIAATESSLRTPAAPTSAVNGDGGPATNAGLEFPPAIAFDASGNFFIVLSEGGRVRRVAAATHIITTFVGFGDRGDSGDRGLATAAEVDAQGLATDAYANLYMTERPGSIRNIDIATGIITRVAKSRYHGYSGNGGSPL